MSNQFFLFLYQQNGLKIDLKMRQRKLKNKKIFASSKNENGLQNFKSCDEKIKLE